MKRCEAELPKERFVCGLKSKERELSLTSRLYGMLFLEIRTYQDHISLFTEEALIIWCLQVLSSANYDLSEHELHSRLTAKEQTQTASRTYAVVRMLLDFLK